MTDGIGTFEHADHSVARQSHGYCTDDMARVLIAVAREPQPDRHVLELGRIAFRFLADAQGVTGRVHNRRSADGRWDDRRSADDCWGRSVWAFGTAARAAPERWMRQSALPYFELGIEARSTWPRAMAFAALGAGEVLAVDPKHYGARGVLVDAVTTIGSPRTEAAWPWPEARLSYANAVLPEALLVAGVYLARSDLVDDGLELLRWLLERETVAGHLSPTPAGGAGPDDRAPEFDQQPIEVAAMADACARAAAVTGDARWARGVTQAAAWFAGDNDAGVVMWDPLTGGGYDGLEAAGANQNQGTESTVALISTLQHVRALIPATG
jgi:hypothetical protein